MAKVGPLVMGVKVAWWFRWLYAPGLYATLALFRALGFDAEPDQEKLDKRLRQACKFRIVPQSELEKP